MFLPGELHHQRMDILHPMEGYDNIMPVINRETQNQSQERDKEQEKIRIEQLVKQRDEDSLNELFTLFYGRVFAAVMVMVRNREITEDITQEAFIKAFNSLSSLREGSKFGPWVVAIATNLARDHFKKEKRIILSPEPYTGKAGLATDDISIEEHILRLEKTEWIRAALHTLSPEQQQVIILHYHYDQKIEYISRMLNISAGTVKSRLHRARGHLYKILSKGEPNNAADSLPDSKTNIGET